MDKPYLIFDEPDHHADNVPQFEGQRISNIDHTPWWDFGDHRLHDCLELVKEAEQVAILYMPHNMTIHFCVQYQNWKSCKLMGIKEWVLQYEKDSTLQVELAQSEINFLRSMYE